MAEALLCATLVPIEEAARMLKTTSLSIYMHIKRKLIVGCEVDDHWFVDGDSLAAFTAVHSGASRGLCRSHCSKAGGCGSSCG
ncbi:MAG: hypothetical protein A2X84_13815 [Desulfuromonadaceae bacterium GWC2_58_13]|nr:MAG: hypothetical protein A2X84_13815 [Desulfuromonadaceae bacterium GWC2_58_13]